MDKRIQKFRLVLVALIAALLGYYVGVNKVNFEWNNYSPKISVVSKEPPVGLTSVDFSQFWAVWNRVQVDYYDKTKLNPQKMLDGAIAGMVQSLEDPFTMYLPPVANGDFKDGLAGQFQGIGAELGMNATNQIIIISPLTGSPAEKAGIKPSDIIYKVDGKSTQGWDLNKAVTTIRGKKGTQVTLTILHKGDTQTKDIKITRDTITVKSVEGWVKQIKDIPAIGESDLLKKNEQSGIAYIRLSQFGDETNKDWSALISKLMLEMQNQQNFKGIILDLRNNPGGYLTDATFIASEFLSQGSTVVVQDNGLEKQKLDTQRQGNLKDKTKYPLIVLINKGSASASEIVSGAMQDYERAILMGEQSFGKGTIQQAEDLGDGAGLHVTIAKWLTPKDRWVHGVGLTPDIVVSLDAKDTARDTQLEKAIEKLLE